MASSFLRRLFCGMLQPFVSLQSNLLLCWHGFCDVNVTLSKSMKNRQRLIPRNWPTELYKWQLHTIVSSGKGMPRSDCTYGIRLAPVLKTIFHQCVIYICSKSYSDGSVLSHQSKTGYKYMI